MSVSNYKCKHCNKRSSADASKAGSYVKCSFCGGLNQQPGGAIERSAADVLETSEIKSMAENPHSFKEPKKKYKSPRWPALISVVAGVIVGPCFFSPFLIFGFHASTSTEEVSLMVSFSLAIMLSVTSIVTAIIALIRCRKQPQAPPTSGAPVGLVIVASVLGVGAVFLFWLALGLLILISHTVT
jgi:hypothetical protein